MKVLFDVAVPMRDDTALVADIQLPGGPGPFPALLQRVPYDRGAPAIRDGALDTVKAARHGYAVVTQDCRGRFGSAGEFTPFLAEADDGVDTVAWIRSQPWSDGRVGMFGRSYSAFVQWQAAARRPEGLLAIAPMFSGAEPVADWFGRGRTLEWGFLVFWALRHLAADAVRRTGSDEATTAVARIAGRIDAVLAESGEETDDVAAVRAALPWLDEWLDDAGREAAFDRIAERTGPATSTEVPALVIAGWYDLFLSGTLRAAAPGAAERQLVVGPWPHGGSNPGVFPEIGFGPTSSGDAIGLTARQLAWFDRWLRDGGGQAPSAPATWFHRGDGWRTGDRWPPRDAATSTLYLGAGGALLPEAPALSPLRLPYDADRPVPTMGGPTFLPGLEVAANAGPRDQGTLSGRSDVLTWLTHPLEAPLEVSGCVACDLQVDLAAGTRLVARLVEAGPDGRLMLVADGGLACPGPGLVSIDLAPVSWTFPARCRVGLLLSATSSPRYRRWAADRADAAPVRGAVTVVTGPASALRLGGPLLRAGRPGTDSPTKGMP
jgi:putative CocE/NonD family hydrolase